MRVDVRVKFLLLIDANIILLMRTQGWIPWSLMTVLTVAFVVQGSIKKGITYFLIYSGMSVVDAFFFNVLVGNWSSFGSMLFVGGRVMLPCFMAGSLILSTTSPQELISVFRRLKLPEGLILTLAVMLRFMPVVRFEFVKIRQSLALRGVFDSWHSQLLHPMRYFEYCIVPLMMSASRIAQDLTVATLTKGVGIQNRKSIYHSYPFGSIDYGIMVYLLIQLVFLGGNR